MPSEDLLAAERQEVAALIAAIRALPEGGSDSRRDSYGPIGRLGVVTGKFQTAPEQRRGICAQAAASILGHDTRADRLAHLNCSECHERDLSGKEVTRW